MVQLMDLVARRDGYVDGVGTWIGEDRNHSFVRLLAAHKANGNDVALILQLLIFQKLGKSGFCTCHLQESITQWCMTMVMQTWYQLKAEELLLASTYDLGYEYVYLRNSWPLNFDYLFLGTPCRGRGKIHYHEK